MSNETATLEAPKVAKKARKAKPKAAKADKVADKGFEPTLPQVRVLRAIAAKPLGRVQVCKRIGLSPISGTMPRCLNGSAKLGIEGLIPAGMVVIEEINLDGMTESLLKITSAGKKALARAIKDAKRLPKMRDASICVNKRYAK